MMWWYYLVPPCILSSITALLYYPSLRYPFLFDDIPTITKNYTIRSLTPKKLLFAHSRWISHLLNQLTYHYWQLDPFAFRIINLIIHIINGTLVFIAAILICKSLAKHSFLHKNKLLFSTMLSALFLLHPVQTQTVCYITQLRLEGLAFLFVFTIIILFLLAKQTKQTWLKTTLYTNIAILLPFAAGTKEIIIILPFLLILAEHFFVNKKTFTLKNLMLHFMFSATLFGTYLGVGSPVKPLHVIEGNTALANNRGNIVTQKATSLITPKDYAISQFRVITHYITMFFWPQQITFDYGWKIPHSFFSWRSFPFFLFLLALLITGILLLLRNKRNIISFCIGWFFIVVIPRSSIIPSTELVCDYKTYIASFGIFFFMAYLLAQLIVKFLSTQKKIQTIQFILPSILIITLSLASKERTTVWESRLSFWKDVIKKTKPNSSARAYNNYAVGLIRTGKTSKGITCYKKAISLDPTYAEPHINLALHYQLKNNTTLALKHYKKAIILKEQHPELYNNLGLLHLTMKNYNKAEKSFLIAIKLRPNYSKAFCNLGKVYQKQNNVKKMLQCYKRAQQGNEPRPEILYTYGLINYHLKNYKTACISLKKLEKIEPNYKNTRKLLSTLLNNT